jgi:hypothetical protein
MTKVPILRGDAKEVEGLGLAFDRVLALLGRSGRLGHQARRFAAGVALLGCAGADITVATTAVGALVGGKPVIDAMRKGPA